MSGCHSVKGFANILEALAECYERSKVGQTGIGKLDVQPRLEDLLAQAGCSEGDTREMAVRQLQEAAKAGLISLEPVHRRDRSDIFKVRLSPEKEDAFFAWLGRPSPRAIREQWSALFLEARSWSVPPEHVESWAAFCEHRATGALHWNDMAEFKRKDLDAGRDLLRIVARLLGWRDKEQFIRVVSCRICGDSKKLERLRYTLEKLVSGATAGRISALAHLGILETPRHVLVAGPLRLRFADHTLDLGQLRDGASVSEADIQRAVIETDAIRCVTVENKTSFHQRALQCPRDLHLHTSYPNAATVALLQKLPRSLEFQHFGDTDPAGFDILRELRETTGLPIQSIGMTFRPGHDSSTLTNEEMRLLEKLSSDPLLAPERRTLQELLSFKRKGAYEQESLQPNHW
ncbi:MAG: Wadjet anti-phage system protein JetD domain-containing protein [Verrucomicrobiota bacterium]